MINKFKNLLIFSLLLLTPLFFVNAQAPGATKPNLVETVGGPTQNVLANTSLSDFSLGAIVAIVIQAALGLLGVIFLVIMVFAGYRWMTASGNEEAVKTSKEMITRAIIGLIIVLMAYAITYFIFNQLPFSGGASQPPAR
jgi:polyferredoxin